MAKPVATPQPPALILAARLRDALKRDPDFGPDDVPTETQGVAEPGAVFHVETPGGARYRVRVNRV